MNKPPVSKPKRVLTHSNLVSRFTSEFGYPPHDAQMVAEKLLACVPKIKAAFLHWWNEGSLDDLVVEGYTVQRLMEEHGMNPIAAFLTLEWLVREPEKAKASLSRGHDRMT